MFSSWVSVTDDKATTRTRLEQEYAFMGVIATFLRAVRAGAVHVRHGAVLLAHYGRLGPAFDGCTKVIVDILREEGVQNHTGEVVVVVVAHAIKEVRFCVPSMCRSNVPLRLDSPSLLCWTVPSLTSHTLLLSPRPYPPASLFAAHSSPSCNVWAVNSPSRYTLSSLRGSPKN
jgi:hypothetical protein